MGWGFQPGDPFEGTDLTSVLIGKDLILSGWWSKIKVIQVLGIYNSSPKSDGLCVITSTQTSQASLRTSRPPQAMRGMAPRRSGVGRMGRAARVSREQGIGRLTRWGLEVHS